MIILINKTTQAGCVNYHVSYCTNLKLQILTCMYIQYIIYTHAYHYVHTYNLYSLSLEQFSNHNVIVITRKVCKLDFTAV